MFRAAERRHFLLLDVLPLIAFLPAVAALVILGVPAAQWAVFAIVWFLTVIGIEVGYHRYFSHAAFQTSDLIKAILVVLASAGGEGSVILWAANHRHHHQFSDQPGDVHSPVATTRGLGARARGVMHAQLLWRWSYPFPNPRYYVPHLVGDSLVVRFSERYYYWVALGLAVPAALGGLVTLSFTGVLVGFLLGGIIRLVICQQGTSLINSACHLVGTRPYVARDGSRNNFCMALPSLGASWHNNHHAFPASATNAHQWWQVDVCWWVLAGLERSKLVWDVRRPSAAGMEKRRPAGEAGIGVPTELRSDRLPSWAVDRPGSMDKGAGDGHGASVDEPRGEKADRRGARLAADNTV